ncbi:hypothetical protein J421_5559 (plasmid) [Gemmatirosa kalamazoonensis]|jgi:hypothetical protein|uniref:Uncharacterized protein n=1 Tax=Gemmatirosa kalamazoonensis TaxID=861299 RepID=W0RQ18_9BACT|nr:hypothetical protein [Gemmatirosa kalamazoonensis]AHG93094.1 hypothetical protein J421_5559 [Gemmatirosa kalamazoonensis]
MRSGDFAVEVVPHGSGRVRELETGHVLARPGQVYRIRLRNLGPLYAVADVKLDGHRVTAGGLVLGPWSATELERPVDAGEHGRFTVVAEGDERVFGPDGGRDDPSLGLLEARFRRELPGHDRRDEPTPRIAMPTAPRRPIPGVPRLPSRFPAGPPEWVPPLNEMPSAPRASAYGGVGQHVEAPMPVERGGPGDAVERAAGTGLTGHSDQQFTPFALGPLETEATVIQLRIVIGTEEALADDAPRPLAGRLAPSRPLARP